MIHDELHYPCKHATSASVPVTVPTVPIVVTLPSPIVQHDSSTSQESGSTSGSVSVSRSVSSSNNVSADLHHSLPFSDPPVASQDYIPVLSDAQLEVILPLSSSDSSSTLNGPQNHHPMQTKSKRWYCSEKTISRVSRLLYVCEFSDCS